MKRIIHQTAIWLLLLAVVAGDWLAAAGPAPAAKGGLAPFDPYILSIIEEQGAADFFVVLKQQADLSAAHDLPTKEARGRWVYHALTEVATRTQGAILNALTERAVTYRPYWIRNMVRVRGDKALLLTMAARPDVAEIIFEYPAVPDVAPAVGLSQASPTTVEWNIARINADDVWGLGITGSGAVLASLDTGAQWNHPALMNSYRPQIPGAPGRHDYNWWDGPTGSSTPIDYERHGTHTVGIMAGYDGGNNQIGVAPGAHWIACAGLGPNVSPTDCFQFFLAPTRLDGTDPRPELAPHVINNSWSSATDYQAIIQTLYAAGIFLAKSAGNTGPSCSTITNPGQWPEVTATAAFGQGDSIYTGSSRGPVTIGHDVLVKPDLAAPGVSVRSSVPGGTYSFLTGTSMAAPHVSGAVGLIISTRPELAGKVDLLQMILKRSAEPRMSSQCPPNDPSGVPNNVWGYGILDAYDAVLLAQSVGLGRVAGQVTDSGTALPISAAAIRFADNATGWPLLAASASDGGYRRTLPAAVYDVNATHYGYLPGLVSGLAITAGLTTTLPIALDPAPLWTVSGTVVEAGTATPLAADIVFDETPISTTSLPETGAYTASVAQGTWWMQVASPGHARAEGQVTVNRNLTRDWQLPAIDNYYLRTADDCNGPTFGWLDASAGTSHTLGDDDSRLVSLPSGRTFTFYGQSYSWLFVGSNGFVSFGAGWDKWSGPIPNPAEPNNAIYAFSTDLNPAAGGQIYTDYLQDRYFVIQYNQVPHYPSGNPETFEIVLDLDRGQVTIQFLTVSDPSEAVVGVENVDGSEATQYAYGDSGLIADGVVLALHPNFGSPPPAGGLGELGGTVQDASTGQPIAGAVVTSTAFTGGQALTYTTGATGVYSDLLCADWYSLTAAAPGYHPTGVTQVAVISGTQVEQDLSLEPILTADLWITKTAPLTASPGAFLSYTLDFGSRGPATVTLAQVWDQLPAAATYITSTGGVYSPTAHSVWWQLSDVLSGTLATRLVLVQVSLPVTATTQLCNQAQLQVWAPALLEDPLPANNQAIACTTVRPEVIYLPLLMRG